MGFTFVLLVLLVSSTSHTLFRDISDEVVYHYPSHEHFITLNLQNHEHDIDRRRLSFFGSVLLNSSTVKDALKKLSTKTFDYSLMQKVEGKWQDKKTWYQGTIVKIHENGTYDIKYVGGDFESEVPPARIRCFGVCPASSSSTSTSVMPPLPPTDEVIASAPAPLPTMIFTTSATTTVASSSSSSSMTNSSVSSSNNSTQHATLPPAQYIEITPSGSTPEERDAQALVQWPPPGLSKQHKDDSRYMRFYKCRDSGEAYSAAYLTTKEHLLNQFTGYNLTWVNCEMGSFIMMESKKENGSMVQSLDVLDFSVVHLSAYERLKRRWRKVLPDFINNKSKNKRDWETGSITEIVKATKILRERAEIMREEGTPLSTPEVNRTVAIMPFLGAENGAGHSKLDNRYEYLKACFWSLYAAIPNIVAAVKNNADYEYARHISGLPFYDVMLLTDLPKNAALPVATVQNTKARIANGTWDFDYIFFTESDQILLLRRHAEFYEHLRQFPRQMIIPHRLIPYPLDVLKYRHKREPSNASNGPYDWMDMTCCMPRQNCRERKDWMHVGNTSVPAVNIYGLEVPLGNNDFHAERYRACTLSESSSPHMYCP